MQTEFGLSQIGQIAIPVSDLERSVAFYRDVLGMKFLFQFPGLAFFDNGGVRLLLEAPQETETTPRRSSIIYYRVADIKSAHNILKERGVEFFGDPHIVIKMSEQDLWMAFFNDPDENILAVMSEVSHA